MTVEIHRLLLESYGVGEILAPVNPNRHDDGMLNVTPDTATDDMRLKGFFVHPSICRHRHQTFITKWRCKDCGEWL